MKLNKKQVAIIKTYLRAVLGAAIAMGIALLTDLSPQYAILIGAIAAPLIKWADKAEAEFGLVSNEAAAEIDKLLKADAKKVAKKSAK
jgi:hypothetical protein